MNLFIHITFFKLDKRIGDEMEDDWMEFYSSRENLENYFEKFDKKNHTYGFIKRKFNYWYKHYVYLKKNDPKFWNYYFSREMEPDLLAYEELSELERKMINN